MAIHGVDTASYLNQFYSSDPQPNSRDNGLAQGKAGNSSPALAFEVYSSNKMLVQYQNKDGDSVSISMESIQYQSAQLIADPNTTTEDWQKLVQQIKNAFIDQNNELIKGLMNALSPSDGTKKANASNEVAQVPEYWNAENTSQRIVDFATSFLDAFAGSGKEFYDLIKGAIEEGFKQAKEIFGDNLPGPVKNLVNQTFDLTMQKLDEWAVAQGYIEDKATDAATQAEAPTPAAMAA